MEQPVRFIGMGRIETGYIEGAETQLLFVIAFVRVLSHMDFLDTMTILRNLNALGESIPDSGG